MQPFRFDLKTQLSQLIHNTASLWSYCIILDNVRRGIASPKIIWTLLGLSHLITLDTAFVTSLSWSIFAITFSQLGPRWFVLDAWSQFFWSLQYLWTFSPIVYYIMLCYIFWNKLYELGVHARRYLFEPQFGIFFIWL